MTLEQKMDEVWEAFKNRPSLPELNLYLDFLTRRGLVSVFGEKIEVTKAFLEGIGRNFARVKQEARLEYLRTKKKRTLDELLLKMSLFQAFEVLTGRKPPVSEEDFELVNSKELGKLCRVLFSLIIGSIKEKRDLLEKVLNEEVYGEAR